MNVEVALCANEPVAVVVGIAVLIRAFAEEIMCDLDPPLELAGEPIVLPDEHSPCDIITTPFYDPKIVEEGMIGVGISSRYPQMLPRHDSARK